MESEERVDNGLLLVDENTAAPPAYLLLLPYVPLALLFSSLGPDTLTPEFMVLMCWPDLQ